MVVNQLNHKPKTIEGFENPAISDVTYEWGGLFDRWDKDPEDRLFRIKYHYNGRPTIMLTRMPLDVSKEDACEAIKALLEIGNAPTSTMRLISNCDCEKCIAERNQTTK